MKIDIIISTQYWENYNWDNFPEGGHRWKAKGEALFIINMDSDDLYYCEKPEAIFNKMLEKQCNDCFRYEYTSHKLHWETPTVLGTAEEFEEIAKQPEFRSTYI